MKIILGYLAWAPYAKLLFEAAAERARAFGYDVVPFCLTPRDPKPRYTWRQLADAWEFRDPLLVDLRERLIGVCSDADIFWNVNGANVHPEWLSDLGTFNVYGCFDDPEATAELSEPVARYFDAAFVGNLSCLPLYQSWGLKRVAWCPIGLVSHDYPEELSTIDLLSRERSVPAVFLGERESPWRRERLDRLASEFPNARFHGNGWPNGRVSDQERRQLYRDSRIGWNIHNSIGPINVRLFALLANGVLQICDNRCRLGQILELEKEVIGFDSIDDCIDRTKYFLSHESEGRQIAANGHMRYLADYSEKRLWEYYISNFVEWMGGDTRPETPVDRLAWVSSEARKSKVSRRKRTARQNIGHAVQRGFQKLGFSLQRTSMTPGAVRCEPEEPAKQTKNVPDTPYIENEEVGAKNLSEKVNRVARGGPFEWPNILALNWAVARLVEDARNILEIGCGTGAFAYEAGADPRRRLLAADGDAKVIEWASTHRKRPNITYTNRWITEEEGDFDLAVAIEIIEHVSDFNRVLRLLSRVSSRAVITTPNRGRSQDTRHHGPPLYYQHVREWTAGEFYWVLRCYWRSVQTFAMPNVYLPEIMPVDVDTSMTPLIAVCTQPYRHGLRE